MSVARPTPTAGPTARGPRPRPRREGDPLTTAGYEDRTSPAEIVAGYMSAAAIFLSVIALVIRPVPLSIAAILLGLVASAIGGRWGRLHAIAVACGTSAFVLGMTIAVVTGRPLF